MQLHLHNLLMYIIMCYNYKEQIHLYTLSIAEWKEWINHSTIVDTGDYLEPGQGNKNDDVTISDSA